MRTEPDFEQAIEAVLDGRPLPGASTHAGDTAVVDDPVHIVAALARVHRVAIFGADAPLDRPPLARWGQLEIRGEIGRGAGGTVYRAWDPNLAREVALKLPACEGSAAAALEEGRLLARLNHPHI